MVIMSDQLNFFRTPEFWKMAAFGTQDFFLTGQKYIWVETDLEPDDYLAINILKRKGYLLHTIVVGEGDVNKKLNRAFYYYGDTCNLIKGVASDKLFPEDQFMCPEVVRDLDSDVGLEFVGKNWQSVELKQYGKDYYSSLKRYCSKYGYIIVILKPPRELFGLFLENPDEIKELLKEITCYMYGSFNLRSLNAEPAKLQEFLQSFGELYIYESYHASGSENTLNPENYSNFDEMVKCLDPDGKFTELMKAWDAFNMEDCLMTCLDIARSEGIEAQIGSRLLSYQELGVELPENKKHRYHRNYKCYQQILHNLGRQFVIADVGLALFMDSPNAWKEVDITIDDKGYTQIKESSSSRIKSVLKVGIDAVKQKLDEIWVPPASQGEKMNLGSEK